MCKPHSMNLIGATEFKNAMSASPRKAQCVPDPFLLLGVESGDETNGVKEVATCTVIL